MKRFVPAIASLFLTASSAQAQQLDLGSRRLSPEDVGKVAPALEKYTQARVLGDVWKRPGLSARDRGIVTLAALIARNQMLEVPTYLAIALENGVKPREVSETITHLAFYSGWGNGMSATAIAKEVFMRRDIGPDQLPAASGPLLPVNEAAEADRAKRVGEQFGALFPGVVQYTTEVLFGDLWLRPALAPRDRSLVTISALVANGQVAQLTGHIPIGMNNGLTQGEIAEALTPLAFYVGWPNVFSAMPVAKDVFEKRGK